MAKRKEIEEQLNYFLNMCPKPFSWEKKKRKRAFFDGKLRGPFLARVALKSYWKKKYMQINLLDVDIQKGELGSSFSNSLLQLSSYFRYWFQNLLYQMSSRLTTNFLYPNHRHLF